jgi:general secretion pathway protein E
MAEAYQPLILSVDDDEEIGRLVGHILRANGYRAVTVCGAAEALAFLETSAVDLILLDALMPEMDGYELCSLLQERPDERYAPVIFLTSLGEAQDRARALAAGAVDYLVKPIRKAELLEKVRQSLAAGRRWASVEAVAGRKSSGDGGKDFNGFKDFVLRSSEVPAGHVAAVRAMEPTDVYRTLAAAGVGEAEAARLMARYLGIEYTGVIDPATLELGVLPLPFSRNNSVVAVKGAGGNRAYVLSNPFDWRLTELLAKYTREREPRLVVAEPEVIDGLLQCGPPADRTIRFEAAKDAGPAAAGAPPAEEDPLGASAASHPVISITNMLLRRAVIERASDIHIEPKEDKTVVRFRVDGDMRDALTVNRETGTMVLTRLKALGGLDITERRKPQDGAMEASIDRRRFKMRLATTSTPSGESMIIRVLEPEARQKDLGELGMTDDQVRTMVDFAGRSHGLVLIVGPTGSGKTTTIYSLLGKIDCHRRSLISVEDPVEYRIPHANQQQVNEKMGVTFEALLKSSVRQDPDILFIGEVRDPYSARIAIDFASTGHVTITTLHTSNATTAIFRLERLGVTRGQMADTVIGIVAQRLLKRLCPYCKRVGPISAGEAEMLAPFTNRPPEVVAHAVGCPRCNGLGYYGREGIYEIIRFDHEIADLVREGLPVAAIRNRIRERGDKLIGSHAVEKIGDLLFDPQEVYSRVLIEEAHHRAGAAKEEGGGKDGAPSILVVDDDGDTQRLVGRFLEQEGYAVTAAADAIDALIRLSTGRFDLIVSDVEMPNLDGFKFLEIKTQKGIDTPLLFLTSHATAEEEEKGLTLGAVDYIRKPVKKELLLLRVKKALRDRGS